MSRCVKREAASVKRKRLDQISGSPLSRALDAPVRTVFNSLPIALVIFELTDILFAIGGGERSLPIALVIFVLTDIGATVWVSLCPKAIVLVHSRRTRWQLRLRGSDYRQRKQQEEADKDFHN